MRVTRPHEGAVIFEYLHIFDVWARPKLFKLPRPLIDHAAQPR
jgi:hypothetical protein